MSESTQTALFEAIAKVTQAKPEEIALDTELDSLGIESLEIAELMFELEDRFSIDFPDEADITKRFETFKTVRDLANALNILIAEQKEA